MGSTHRYLLFQARRPGDQVRAEERAAFAERLEVDLEAVVPFSILDGSFDPEQLQDVDAVLVGGAGEFSVVDPEPAVQRFIRSITLIAEGGTPTFASCFGYQALVVGFGGEVISDEPNAEVGTYTLERTEEGAQDALFSSMPDTFEAQLGHKDRATRLPPGVPNLAGSQRSPFQALRFPNLPVYATQFHPELTYLDNRLRFQRYMDEYGRLFGQEEAKRRLEAHRPSPESNTLLRQFARMFVENRG